MDYPYYVPIEYDRTDVEYRYVIIDKGTDEE